MMWQTNTVLSFYKQRKYAMRPRNDSWHTGHTTEPSKHARSLQCYVKRALSSLHLTMIPLSKEEAFRPVLKKKSLLLR